MEDIMEDNIDKYLEMSEEEFAEVEAEIVNEIPEVEEEVEDKDDTSEDDTSGDDTDTDESGDDDIVSEDDKTEDNSEDNNEDNSEENNELINDILSGKKARIKWNGTETDIEAEKLIELAQKGIDYDIKKAKLKEDQVIADKLRSNGISEKDIEAFIKFKSDPENGVKDFIALQGLDLDEIRDKMYDFDVDEVKERQNYYEEIDKNYNPVDEIIKTVPEEINYKYDELTKTIPGLKEFSQRIYNNRNVETFQTMIQAINDGSFERSRDGLINRFVKMSEVEKQRLLTDDDFFINTYNSVVSGIPAQASKPDVPEYDIEEKKRFSKPTKPKKVVNKKKTTEDILNSYLNMSDEEFEQKLQNIRSER